MFDGGYVVDEFALVLKALFLLTGYVVVLLSSNEIEEGGYYQGEYYVLLLSSVLGMVMMASSRDLVSIFIALEFLSIPAYMLAAWRKRDRQEQRGRRQVLPARRVRLRRDAVRHEPALRRDRHHPAGRHRRRDHRTRTARRRRGARRRVRHRRLRLQGLAPCRSTQWAPDTYEGAPTPVTAFLSRGLQGGRLRRPDRAGVRRVPAGRRTSTSRSSGCWPRCR